MIELIPAGGNILDCGCGTGEPIMNYFLDKGFAVTGLDASEKMLGLARANFPEAALVLSDMRRLKLNKKFDAIIAWHSFFHLPAADQPDMFAKFEEHLNPNGILLFTSGSKNGEAWAINGGESLFHASLDAVEYQNLLEKHDFKILDHKINDSRCGNATVWLVQYNQQ
ncbi:MAG: class I SAM-dependent methyltransferase [Sphingobacteriales bacterium]|nr:MAG: class I SAM-dependent methyltransferase [Sphingobacteriales bacterium]